ncbi:DUF817 domain-containing protein, partial [Morganella morganii]|nr:DUF817 domain-containing protein [Morganella morganii]
MRGRFAAVLLAQKRSSLTGWRRFILEFWFFGLKEARACLFAAFFFLALFLVHAAGVA